MERRILIAFFLLLHSSLAFSQEWPRFRGPNGAGLSDAATIPVQWTDKDYTWRISLPGGGHSSPVLWGNRIFITSADNDTAQRTLLCINASDGAVLWKRQYQSHPYKMHFENSYASSSPAADDSAVYFYWATPESSSLIALDHDGKDLWHADIGPFISQHGSGSSPILFEDLVILPNDQEGPRSFIIACDRKTGQTRWKAPRTSDRSAASTPCIYQPPGSPPQLILTSRTEGITSLDPRTGAMLWQLRDVFDRRVVASPIVAGDLVIGNCGEAQAGRLLIAVRPGSKDQKPLVAYTLTVNPPYVPTPLAKGDLLFLLTDSGVASCLRASTGKLIWQQRLNAPFYGSFVCVADRLYAISRKGDVFVLSASEKFQLLARNPLGENSYATPAIANGRMYLRTYSHLICLSSTPKQPP